MFQEDDIFGVPSPRVDGVYKIASKLTWQISTIVVREAIVRLEEVLKVFLIAISLVLLLLHYCHWELADGLQQILILLPCFWCVYDVRYIQVFKCLVLNAPWL